MKAHINKQHNKQDPSPANRTADSQSQATEDFANPFVNNRPEAIAQRKQYDLANRGPRAQWESQLQAMADRHVIQQKREPSLRNPAMPQMPIIQRLTAGAPNSPANKHNDNPVRSVVHNVTEAVTNQEGDGSDTGNFKHANGSEYMDGRRVTYYGLHIADLVTKGGDHNSIVKMHMVNSYLHPNANAWKKNWVYGAKQLNTDHVAEETAAKLVHHSSVPANLSLNYETEVSAGNAPQNDNGGLLPLLQGIVSNSLGVLYQNAHPPTAKGFRIEGENIATFENNWANALAVCATEQIIVRYRITTGNAWGPTTVAPPVANSNQGNGFYPWPSAQAGLDSIKLYQKYDDNELPKEPEFKGRKRRASRSDTNKRAEKVVNNRGQSV